MNALNSEIERIIKKLKNNRSSLSRDETLNQLNERIDKIIENMSVLPIVIDEESLHNIRNNITSLRQSLSQQSRYLVKEQKDLTSESEGIKQEFQDTKNQITDFYKDLKESFEESAHEILETGKQEFDKKLNDLKTSMEKEEEDFYSYQQELTELRNEKQKEYDDALEEHKKSVEKLAGILSTNTISAHFKKVADRHKKLSNWWQGGTLVGFLLTISFGFYFFVGQGSTLSWVDLISKIIVTSALGSFTGYASYQVSKNEQEEKYNRQMEVELKTLDPYLSTFYESEQNKLKELLFPLIFGQNSHIGNNNVEKFQSHINEDKEDN